MKKVIIAAAIMCVLVFAAPAAIAATATIPEMIHITCFNFMIFTSKVIFPYYNLKFSGCQPLY